MKKTLARDWNSINLDVGTGKGACFSMAKTPKRNAKTGRFVKSGATKKAKKKK